MALLDEKHLAAERARAAKFRTHHVGTKLNEHELQEFEALAEKRGQSPSELIRGLVLGEIERDRTPVEASLELTETTAVRLLLINLLRPMVTGGTMTEKTFDGIIDETKKRKGQVAQAMVEERQKRGRKP